MNTLVGGTTKVLVDELSGEARAHTGDDMGEGAMQTQLLCLIIFDNVEFNLVKVISVFCFDNGITVLKVAKSSV